MKEWTNDWEKQWYKGKEGWVKKKRRSMRCTEDGWLGVGLARVGSVSGVGKRLTGGSRHVCV